MEIKLGSVVQLKSGGPKMTVKIKDGDLWKCTWFINLEVREHSFADHELHLIAI